MILDLAREELPEFLDLQVVVVGAGPAGISLALELETLGVPVLLLEAGGRRINAAGQDIYRAESLHGGHGPVHRYRHRVLGGTSAVWGGRCIPLDPIDLEDRPWIPHAKWPISYGDLAQHYPRALALCQAGSACFIASEALPHEDGAGIFDMRDADLVTDRVERFSEPTHFGRRYHDQLKRSSLVTAVMNASVLRVTAEEGGRRVKGVTICLPNGSRQSLLAGTVVIATGAIETARLLLSSDTEKRCGLGNERDLVGRFYQSHLEGHVGELVLTPGAAARMDYGRDAAGVYCRRYLWLSPEAQRREQLAGLAMRPTHAKVADPEHGHPVLSAMYLVKGMLLPEYARGMNSTEHAEAGRVGRASDVYLRHIANVVRGSPRLAAFAADWTRRRVLAKRKLPSVFLTDPTGHYPIDVNAEQTPNPGSRIMLGDRRDALGQRRVVIRWRASQEDRLRVARGVSVAGRALERAGVGRIFMHDIEQQLARLTPIGGHHIGTARMAETSSSGVVDRHGEAFDVSGLYVLGAASFPTSGFANPTLTIVALAIRMAGRVAQKRPSRPSK